MPSYYDESTKSWYCKFNYTDWNGQHRQKMKRGFTKKKDAKDWESRFIASRKYDSKTTIGMITADFLQEITPRRRYTTISNYRNAFKNYINPAFEDLPISALTEKHIVDWQNNLITSGLADTYIYKLDTIFRTVYRFGARRCKISENPFDGLEKIGKSRAQTMQFWTLDQYREFISRVDDPVKYIAFEILYYTGIRLGELIPLTAADADTENGILHINKSLQRVKGEEIITPPKTAKGTRDIIIPLFLCDELTAYKERLYGCNDDTRLFTMSKCALYYPMKKYSKLAGVPRIRLHDLRHSHVALLIEHNVSPLVIAERLGHESIDVTLGTYGHLYPNKQQEVADILDSL